MFQFCYNRSCEEGIYLFKMEQNSKHFIEQSCGAIQLGFRDVAVVVDGTNKIILHPATGKFSAGSFTALIGPSGSSKTTLMNILAGRALSDNLQTYGELFVNSEQTFNINEYHDFIGFVMQEDLLFPTFTPRQSFQFVVKLRLPRLDEEQIKEKVQTTIERLGLRKCADTYIGNNMIRGISGGQRKRTAIGVELLTKPKLLFLDQPTTGLDSTTALNIMNFIKTIAKEGCTVISTIHQPSSELFNEFNDLMLLCEGHQIFLGPKQKAQMMFENVGYKHPGFMNPSDFYMKLLNKQGNLHQTQEEINAEYSQRVQKLHQYYKENLSISPVGDGQQQRINKCLEVERASWLLSTWLILKRTAQSSVRSTMNLPVKILQIVVQATLGAILYYSKEDNISIFQRNISSAIFFSCLLTFMGAILSTIGTFMLNRNIFMRERMSSLYTTSSFYLGIVIADLPWHVLLVTLFTLITYFAMNFSETASQFFIHYAFIIAIYLVGTALGTFWSILIDDYEVVVSLIIVIFIPFILVAGFFTASLPGWLIWLQYLSPVKFGFAGMLQNQFPGNETCLNVLTNQTQTCQYVNVNFPRIEQSMWLNFGIIWIFYLGLNVISFIMLVIFSSPKQAVLQLPKQFKYRSDETQHNLDRI